MPRGGYLDYSGLQPKIALEVRQEAVHQGLETTTERVSEPGIGSHRLGRWGQRALDHLFEIGERHPPTEPGGLHLLEGNRPELLVVGNGKVLGDSPAPH